MVLKFNKSIPIGKIFRINLSKKGIGYSYGIKGYRISKSADGNTKHTVSIPNTGISYVKEYKYNKKNIDNNKTKINFKVILLFIISILFLPLAPSIILTTILLKSNLQKNKKITFVILTWIINIILISAIV